MGCGSSSEVAIPGGDGRVPGDRNVVTESVNKSAAPQEHVEIKTKPAAVQIDVVEELDGSLQQSPPSGGGCSDRVQENDIAEVNRLLEMPTEYLQDAAQLQLSEKPARQSLQAATKHEPTSPSRNFTSLVEMPTQAMEMPSQIISPTLNKTASFRDSRQEQQQQLEVEEPAAPDPWASMATQYQLRESTDLPSGTGRNTGGPGRFSKAGHTSSNRKGAAHIMEYDEEQGGMRSSAGMGGNTAKLRQGTRKLLPPISGPKTGGWGQGSMAMAGTLMLGDEDEILQGKPQATTPAAAAARQTDDEVDLGMDDGAPARGKPASTEVEDLGMEEIEDVDTLLASEMENQGLNKDLAAKLRQFEAMQDDD